MARQWLRISIALGSAALAHAAVLQLLSIPAPTQPSPQPAVAVELRQAPAHTTDDGKRQAEQTVTTRNASTHQQTPKPPREDEAAGSAEHEAPLTAPIKPQTPPPEPREVASPVEKPAPQQVSGTSKTAEQAASPSPAASTPTSGRAMDAAREQYRDRLRSYLESHQHYPMLARKNRQEGLVKVYLQMTDKGQLLDSHLTQSSPHPLLNREALAMVQRAAPFPEVPPVLRDQVLEWNVPIHFRLP